MNTRSIVLMCLVAGVIGFTPALLLTTYPDSAAYAGDGPAGIMQNPAVPTVKSGSTDELSIFIDTCGSNTTVCSFKQGTTLTISAECGCASRRIILNAATLRKIIDGGMSTPLGTVKLITTQNSKPN